MPATPPPAFPPPHVLRDARHVVTNPQDYADRPGLIDLCWRALRNAAGERSLQSKKLHPTPTPGPTQ